MGNEPVMNDEQVNLHGLVRRGLRDLALALVIGLVGLALSGGYASAQDIATVTQVCPTVGIREVASGYQPGGIILTAFDKTAIWVYNIDNGRRYPLPDTAPCGRNCHLSPDATWLTYFNDPTNTFNIMRLDGTQRRLVAENAAEVAWWNDTTYLVWTPGKEAYLQPVDSEEREYLDVSSVASIQPGGRYGLVIEPEEDSFKRSLVNLETRGTEAADAGVDLGADTAYFNARAWSSDGAWLAYVSSVTVGSATGSEIFGIQPGDTAPAQWTRLSEQYGAARINGVSVGELSWSPDNTRIAFWVSEITGEDATANIGSAVIHILDVNTGEVKAYCGYATPEQTPNPPRLVWSPDGTHLAFGGAVPNDPRGYQLLVMDTESGEISSLSIGIVAALGSPDVIAWGNLPQ
jgi:WD40 repeat protein